VPANHAELPPPEPALPEFEPHVSATRFAVVPDRVAASAGSSS
jgi:hypothetical protein